MMPEMQDLIILLLVGLLGGVMGGLLGIGGSVIFIPVMTSLLAADQHLAQAAAMVTNVVVAVPSVYRHQRCGNVRWPILRILIPATLVCIMAGVYVSNFIPSTLLGILFGVFLLYVIFFLLQRTIRHWRKGVLPPYGRVPTGDTPRETMGLEHTRILLVGGVTGLIAGLLGVGGGIIAVPLLSRYCGIPLRASIALSSGMICFSAGFGALQKILTLPSHEVAGLPLVPADALVLAACLAPTALIGGLLGAGWTGRLPLQFIRISFIVLLGIACCRYLGLFLQY